MSFILTVFQTYRYSLNEWEKTGILSRELLLYDKLKVYGVETQFVSYGEQSMELGRLLSGEYSVLARPAKQSIWWFSLCSAIRYRQQLRESNVLKTHQNQGAISGVVAKIITGKPLIARCGYLKSAFANLENESGWSRFKIWLEEAISFHVADIVCVSSKEQADIAVRKYLLKRAKVRVCPNGIDTNIFKPEKKTTEKYTICFVGRFSWKKGPDYLLQAINGIENLRLVMIGDGPLLEQSRDYAAKNNLDVEFIGRIANETIPDYLNSSDLYILPSHHEGSPKTLLEAMSCALPVISTDGFGVNEVFTDGVEGKKIKFGDVEGLRDAILWMREHPNEAKEMGKRGRQRVVEHYSIEKALERELDILEELTGEKLRA